VVVIAFVEDDPSILDAARLVIEAMGWEARLYPDGESFVDDYRQRPNCDCLVLDPHLPGISGVDVARAVADRQVPVVVLTAHPDSALTQAVVKLGARAVMTKPVSEQKLLEAIAAVLPAASLP
jgi:FixJ family two-component response regulator